MPCNNDCFFKCTEVRSRNEATTSESNPKEIKWMWAFIRLPVCVTLTSLFSLSNTNCCVTTSPQFLSTSSPRCVSSHSFSFTKAVTWTKHTQDTHTALTSRSIWTFQVQQQDFMLLKFVIHPQTCNWRSNFWHFPNFSFFFFFKLESIRWNFFITMGNSQIHKIKHTHTHRPEC